MLSAQRALFGPVRGESAEWLFFKDNSCWFHVVHRRVFIVGAPWNEQILHVQCKHIMNPSLAESGIEVADWNTGGNNEIGEESDSERGEVSII